MYEYDNYDDYCNDMTFIKYDTGCLQNIAAHTYHLFSSYEVKMWAWSILVDRLMMNIHCYYLIGWAENAGNYPETSCDVTLESVAVV